LTQLASKARTVVRDLDPGVRLLAKVEADCVRAQNELTFLRIRTKKHEIMVAPGALFVAKD
jgi:hypothetical protein